MTENKIAREQVSPIEVSVEKENESVVLNDLVWICSLYFEEFQSNSSTQPMIIEIQQTSQETQQSNTSETQQVTAHLRITNEIVESIKEGEPKACN